MLTDLQAKKHSHQFHVMDQNGDGRLEWSDYERIAERMVEVRGWAPDAPQAKALVGAYRYAWEQSAPFQTDGAFELDAWLTYQVALMGSDEAFDAVIKGTSALIFDTFDLDGDGRVSVEEWRAFFRCYGIDEAHADACFPKYDLNGDGYVTRDELLQLADEFFRSSDPDAPGNLLFGPMD